MWSMPRSVLRVVAVIIAALAVTGFVLGIRGAPDKPRLPGEGLPGNGATPVQAADATPLSEEAPPAPSPPPAEKKDDTEKTDEAAETVAAAAAKLPPPVIKPATPAAGPGNEDHVGDLIDGLTPPPQEDPPH
jgi:hypothetical protein